VLITTDRNYVDITFNVEEGLQYSIGSIDVSGDILYDKEKLIKWMSLKPGELFRYSKFQKDIEMLVDKYGDLGYAYVDPNPKTRFNDATKTVDLNYEITKGEKVYFGTFSVVGNTKTRDNVIRREFEVADSELYSGTRLRTSKDNVQRLGFFEEVQFLKERDGEDPTVLNYKVKVKEKPTGQLQAALGYSPGGATKASWFGQGRYDEKNQSGKGWATDFSLRYDGNKSLKLSGGFSDPRVRDSQWSLGTNLDYESYETSYVQGVNVNEVRKTASLSVGRQIIELIRAGITYRFTQVTQDQKVFIFEKFKSEGIKKAVSLGLSRSDLNDFLDPTEGSTLSLRHSFNGGPLLGGDFRFMETMVEASYYFPIDFTDTFRTHFKFYGNLGKLWPYQNEPIPLVERYRLGGQGNLRGYDFNRISPYYALQRSPDLTTTYYSGGDKQLYFQLEYFVPLIPEAGIKALVFMDSGRVFDDSEDVSFGQLKRDVGYGFRWVTPIAPFRFEFAYPIEGNGTLGDPKPIFSIGI
jgi:outer membrane protein insertion porin family